MTKRIYLIFFIYFSLNASAQFEPSILGVSGGFSGVGTDPGFKFELSTPNFIRDRTALNLEYGLYSSSLSGGTDFYGILFLGAKTKIHSSELFSIYFKTNAIIAPASSLSNRSPAGLNYAVTSYIKVPDSTLQLQAELGYNLFFASSAEKINGQSYGNGPAVTIGVAYPF